jgi:hypothetical protein
VTIHHPARWSEPVLRQLHLYLVNEPLHIHDPFAGTGNRLGDLADWIGAGFSGTEIEPEWIVDDRVMCGDSTDAGTYPREPFIVVTSPVYPNGMTDHFRAVPGDRRMTYRHQLATTTGGDRELHPHNMGRYGNAIRRGAKSEATYWDLANRCVRWWPDKVYVNVKDCYALGRRVEVVKGWEVLLESHGYGGSRIRVPTPGYRDGANREARVYHEVILIGERT